MNGGLLDYILLRCPFCKYVWSKREERMPISCPRCKKRFDYRGNHVEPEQRTLTAESYSDLRECLYDANRHSLQCASLEEVLDRMAQSWKSAATLTHVNRRKWRICGRHLHFGSGSNLSRTTIDCFSSISFLLRAQVWVVVFKVYNTLLGFVYSTSLRWWDELGPWSMALLMTYSTGYTMSFLPLIKTSFSVVKPFASLLNRASFACSAGTFFLPP